MKLFYIANIDADYVRRFNNKFLSGIIWYTYYQSFFRYNVPDTDFRTTKKKKKKKKTIFNLGKITRFPIT